LHFDSGHSKPGGYVDLRFEMHALVVLATCQHPLDPRREYDPREVQVIAWLSGVAPQKDICRDRCPENQRGFHNTEALYR